MENQNTGVSIYKQALEITWLTAIFLIPLFFNPLSYQIFYLNKALLLQFLVIAMLAFWVADWIQRPTSHQKLNWKNIFTSPLYLAILVFGLIAVLATAASITPAISFWGSYFRKAGLLTLICWITFFLIVSQQLRTKAQLFRAIYVLLASSGIVSYVGILQHFFPNVTLKLLHSAYTSRIYSTTGNALSLSCFLAMVIPFNLALIVHSWSKRQEGKNATILIGLVLLLALQFWCLWLAQYSITILLYIIAPIIFILLLGWAKRKKLLLGFGAASLIGLVIIAGLLLVPFLLSPPSIETTGAKDLEPVPISEELGLKTLGWRIQYWQGAINIVTKSPEVPFSNDRLHDFRRLIGYGPETFVITYQLFWPEKMEEYGNLLVTPLTRPHNHYLYLATTMGLLGMMSFLSILAVFFYLCFRHLRKATASIEKLLLIAMMAGITQYMADIFFNPSSISPELVFWLTLSFVPVIVRLATGNLPVRTSSEGVAQIDNSQKSHVNKVRRYVSGVCALLIILIGIGITIRPFLADIYLQKGLKQGGNIEQAIPAFKNAIKMAPDEAAYWNSLGSYAYWVAHNMKEETLKTESLTLATNAYEKARELEPYIAFRYYALADIYTYRANQGAVDKWPMALSMYDKASQLIPRNPLILNMWSLALIIEGDFSQAQTKLAYSASIDPDWTETSFLSGLLLAREGKHDGAVLKITAPIQKNPANLNYFAAICSNLTEYAMVQPLQEALETYSPKAPDEWTLHAALGVTSFFVGNLDKSLDEFGSAMLLVPNDKAGYLFQTILDLSNLSPSFKTKLSGVAAEWRAKLAQSPQRDTLLPALEQFIDNQK